MLSHNTQALAAQQHGSETPLAPEPDKLPVGFLAGFIAAIIVVVAVVGVVAQQLLLESARHQVQQVDLSVPNPQLQELNAQEEAALGNYDVVDKDKGLYRIPINQAIDLYVSGQGGGTSK